MVRCLNFTAAVLMAGFAGEAVTSFAEAADVPDLSATTTASAAGRSTALQEVVVTAERRKSSVQKTASSISVRSGGQLQAQGKYALSQILEDVPGVSGGATSTVGQSSGSDTAAGGLTIRGIQSNVGSNTSITTVAPTAAVYVDGIYEGVGSTYDIDRVEILRGPQGTLYGRSATSGVVAFHTTDPNLERLEANAAIEFGNYALQHYTAGISLPFVKDELALRISGNYYQRNGYYLTKGDERSNADGKFKLLYRLNEDFNVLLGTALEDNNTHTGQYSQQLGKPNQFIFVPTPVTPGSNRFRQYWAEMNWNLGLGTLTYLPAYRTWESQAAIIQAASNLPFDLYQTVNIPKDHFNTQELRLASDSGSKLKWQIGALYYDNKLSNADVVHLGTASGPLAFDNQTRNKETLAAGAFGEATYPIADDWRVTGGLRYDYTKVAVDQAYTSQTGITETISGSAGTRQFRNLTYKARIEHDLASRHLVYAMVSTGFSPGDVSVTTGLSGNPILLNLKAETLTSFEVGSKNRFLDDSLQINGDIYYYDYGAFQTAINASGPGGLPTQLEVAAPARVAGAELETTYNLTAADRVGLNLAFTDAYFVNKDSVEVPTGAGTFVTFGEFFAKRAIPGVSPFTATVDYSHSFLLSDGSSLKFHGDVRYLAPNDGTAITTDEVNALDYYGNSYAADIHVGAQVVGDIDLGWQSSNGKYGVTGYVRNVGNNQYKTSLSIAGSYTPGAPQSSQPVVSGVPYDPRTYGVVLSARF